MDLDAIIKEIIQNYGMSLWVSFVALFLAGLAALAIKNLIQDVSNYIATRMSDLGYGAIILWDGKRKRVVEIKFRKIKVVDDDEIAFIPIEAWLKSVQKYPQPRKNEFTEVWDGKVDRRKNNNLEKEN